MYYGTYEGHTYAKCTQSTCEDCNGRGEVLDAPADVLGGRSYWTPCTTCGGRGHTRCGGCRGEGMDCMYDCLSYCTVCGALEGALLPVCPGRRLTEQEHDQNYADYCAGSGPFREANIKHDITEARVFAERYVSEDPAAIDSTEPCGARRFYDAVNELWHLIHGTAH